MKRAVTTYYLEMLSPAELRPSAPREPGLLVQQALVASPELNRFFYTAVGGDWYWLERLEWTYDQWLAYLRRPELETWVGYVRGTPAGYVELERQAGQVVEIAYFGLLPQFVGQGIGGALLTAAIERAWQGGTQRVWVHTCSLDGPAALRNYQARGFRLYDQQTEQEDLPDASPGPWAGARPAITAPAAEGSEHVPMSGVVIAVSSSATHSFSKPNQGRITLLAGLGVEGDAHMGETVKHRSRVARDPSQPNLRQAHLIHAELHDALRAAGFAVSAGDMGENITTRGLDLLGLPTGTRLHIGAKAVIEVTGLRNPCAQLDHFQPGLMAAVLDRDAQGNLIRKAGVMGIVLAGGELQPGDNIRVELPPEPHRPLEPV